MPSPSGASVGGWHPLARLTLKVQFDGHTAFYKDSDLVELSSGSVQIVMGGTLHSDRTALDMGPSEDLVVNTAPEWSSTLPCVTDFNAPALTGKRLAVTLTPVLTEERIVMRITDGN